MQTPRNILFATDGRAPAVAAGELLRRLVNPSRVEVTVLHAAEFGNELVAERYAQDVFAATETLFGGAGIPTHLVSTQGGPAGSIGKELAHGIHGLTVMGAGNHTWLGRLVLGSVSTHILHTAPTPVLIVQRAPQVEHDRLKVLIGSDGSPAVMEAIDTLLAVTDRDRVELAVRTTIRTPDFTFSAYPGGAVPTKYIVELITREREAAAASLEGTLEHLRVAGFAATGSLGGGWPANDLFDQADRGEMDIIVVGARGVGRIERLALGSVSSHVARHAPATLVAHAQVKPVEEPVREGSEIDRSGENREPMRIGRGPGSLAHLIELEHRATSHPKDGADAER